nr:MAG TPA: hypothetical protein [Caudoviricetes sp.]
MIESLLLLYNTANLYTHIGVFKHAYPWECNKFPYTYHVISSKLYSFY